MTGIRYGRQYWIIGVTSLLANAVFLCIFIASNRSEHKVSRDKTGLDTDSGAVHALMINQNLYLTKEDLFYFSSFIKGCENLAARNENNDLDSRIHGGKYFLRKAGNLYQVLSRDGEVVIADFSIISGKILFNFFPSLTNEQDDYEKSIKFMLAAIK